CPWLASREYSPLSLVLPVEPGPASIAPFGALGTKLTVASDNGLPLRVTLPETGAKRDPPQPSANTTARPSRKHARMVNLLQSGSRRSRRVRRVRADATHPTVYSLTTPRNWASLPPPPRWREP